MLCCAVHNTVLENVAYKQSASQISAFKDLSGTRSPTLANDGNRETSDTVCASSQRETNPWWSVDLGGQTVVCLVKLTNAAGSDKGAHFSVSFVRVICCRPVNKVSP